MNIEYVNNLNKQKSEDVMTTENQTTITPVEVKSARISTSKLFGIEKEPRSLKALSLRPTKSIKRKESLRPLKKIK